MQPVTDRVIALVRKGDAPAALKLVNELGLAAPGMLDLVPLLARELHVSGHVRSARMLAHEALRAAPDSADLNAVAGNVALADGMPDEAIPYFERAIQLDPDWGSPHLYLAEALRGTGRRREAIAVLLPLTAREDSTPLRQRLCQLYLDVGEADAALVQAKAALRQDPADPNSRELMGRALLATGMGGRACSVLRSLVDNRPQDPMHRLFLARAMRIQGQFAAAMKTLGEAAAFEGAPAAVYAEYADIALQLDRPGDALRMIERAHERGIRDVGLRQKEGRLRRQLGDFAGAAAAYQAIHRARPDDLFAAFQHRLNFPVIPPDEAEIDRLRRDAGEVLDTIVSRGFESSEPLEQFTITPFYFAYHDRDDLSLNAAFSQAYRTLFRRQLKTAQNAADVKRRTMRTGGPRRIGIVSSFLRSHTIGRLNELLLRHLSGTDLQLVLVRGTAATDAMAQRLERYADETHVLPAELATAAEAMAALGLDLIFYPELAMEPLAYALAHLRLAPAQVTTWGHPVSSGIDTIDYFLSSRRFEPEGAQRHYSERLVQFDDANLYFDVVRHRRQLAESDGDGAPEPKGGARFGCLQSAFKFHPGFDRLLRSLLARDPSFQIYLVEDALGGHMSGRLRQRLRDSLGPHMAQVVFLPAMPRQEFLLVCRSMTCMLDIPSFSGGNTTLEAFMLGRPVVSMPSSHLKGRLTAGMYSQMGIGGLVAGDAEGYVEIAARLAAEPGFRTEMCETIRARIDRLLPSEQHLAEVQGFFSDPRRHE